MSDDERWIVAILPSTEVNFTFTNWFTNYKDAMEEYKRIKPKGNGEIYLLHVSRKKPRDAS